MVGLIAGLVIGFALSTFGYRYGILHLPGERPFERMARVLELTPPQREQVRDVMHQTRAKVEAARDNFEQQRRALFVSAYLRIRAVLTPEQRRIFDSRFVPARIRAAAEAQERSGGTASPSPSAATP